MYVETFSEHVRELQDRRGWSQARLINEASGYEIDGTSTETIRNAVTGRRGSGWPSLVAIEAIARALEVDPNEFTVYKIQRAQQRINPEIVGLASALANAEILLSQPIPEDLAEEEAQRREAPRPGGASSSPLRTEKGREA
jgi:transcriptional regulator with XRE-family HTH domain